jgi:hypothetical protein
MKIEPTRSPRRGLLANGIALVIVAVMSGVLAPLLVETDAPQPTEPAADYRSDTSKAADQSGEQERQLVDTMGDASAHEDVAALKSRLAAEVADRLKLSEALEHERQKAAALEVDLRSTRAQVEHLLAKAAQVQAEASEHKEALDRARLRASVLEPPAFVLGTPTPVKTTSVSAHSQRKVAPLASPHSDALGNAGDKFTNHR